MGFNQLKKNTHPKVFLERKGKIGDGGGRGEKRKTDVKKNMNQLPPIKDQICHLGICPDQELEPQPFGVLHNIPTN